VVAAVSMDPLRRGPPAWQNRPMGARCLSPRWPRSPLALARGRRAGRQVHGACHPEADLWPRDLLVMPHVDEGAGTEEVSFLLTPPTPPPGAGARGKCSS